MLSTFLSHQWLSFWRSRNSNKSVAVRIILGLFYLLIFLEVAGLGILLPYLLPDYFPGKDPINLFTSYLLYYFLLGLLVRFQLQELPSLTIQPYLTKNIKRASMLRFLNVRSLFHVINFLPLFIFLPFTIVRIVPGYGVFASCCFLAAMFALVINNHFLNLHIKRKSIHNSWWLVSMLLLIACLKGMDYFKIVSTERASAFLFNSLLYYPLLCLLPILLAFFTFWVNNKYLRSHLYLEELASDQKLRVGQNYSFLDRFGEMGDLIALDLKLIFRNKRPRSLLILSAVFLLYGLLFYPQYIAKENYTMLFLFALIITGLFISNYGQFLFAWQSSHFDGIMVYNTNMQQYIKAKFLLFLTVCTLQFLIASLYGLMDWRIIPIQLAAYIYSIGVNSFVTIYAATFNYKYLDLTKSANMNFQGVGALQWLQSLSISFGPVLVFYLLLKGWGFWTAVIGISLPGLAGLIWYNQLIRWLANQFRYRKYKILEGFRER